MASDAELLIAVEEALLGRLSKQYQSLSVNGQMISLLDPAALLRVRDDLKRRVAATSAPNRSFVRFNTE